MRSRGKAIEGEQLVQSQVLALTLAGAKDLEVCKSLRISAHRLNEIWTELGGGNSFQERFEVVTAHFGQSVAAVWKSKQDLENRLREEIFDHETEQALLNEITLITNTGGWSMELSNRQIVWTGGINAILNRPLDAEPLDPKEVQALVHPEDQPMHRKAVERLMAEGTVFNMTYRMVIDGEIKHIRSVTRAHFDDLGKLIRIFGTITDETEILRLRDSELVGKRMLESIAAILPDAVYVFDAECGSTVYSNRNIAASLGYSQLDSQDMGPGVPNALLHPNDLAKFEEFRKKIHSLSDRETREIEVRLRHVDSRWMYFILNQVVFTRNVQGVVKQVLTTMHDITTLRESQKALIQSEDMLSHCFQDAPVGMAVFSLEGVYEKVNPAYAEICGYSIEELLGKNILLVNDPDEVNRYLDYLCEAMSDPKMPPYRAEKQTIRKDGSKLWVNVVCSILWDGEGRAVRVISQIQDISAKRAAAELEREADARLQTTVNSLHAGVMLVQRDSRISIVNPSAASILGVRLEDLKDQRIEKPFWSLFDPEGTQISEDQRPLRRALAGETVPPTEMKLVTEHGAESWIKVSCSPLTHPDQPLPYAAVLTFSDVTSEVESRATFRESLNRLNELNVALEINRDDLEQQKIRLEEANVHLEQLATTDDLTGLWNSRRSREYLQDRIRESARYGRPLSIAMIDVDYFKSLNDECGHIVGDRVLCDVAQILQQSVRTTDFVGRYGGEEFLAIMPEIEIEDALIAAERLRRSIEQKLRDPYEITVSIGVATFVSATEEDGNALIDTAGTALYESKRNGRNKVTLAPVEFPNHFAA